METTKINEKRGRDRPIFLKKTSWNSQNLPKFCQSVEIILNLVTLLKRVLSAEILQLLFPDILSFSVQTRWFYVNSRLWDVSSNYLNITIKTFNLVLTKRDYDFYNVCSPICFFNILNKCASRGFFSILFNKNVKEKLKTSTGFELGTNCC